MIQRLRIAQKLWLSVVIIVTMMVSVIGFAAYRSATAQKVADSVNAQMNERVQGAIRWVGLTEMNAARTLALILSSDALVEAEFKDAIAATSAQISELQKSLEAIATSDADKAQMAKIAASRKTMIDLRNEARKLKSDGNAEAAIKLVRDRYNPAVTAYVQTLRDFVQLQQQTAARELQAIAESRMMTIKIAATASGLVLVFIAVGAFFLIRSILQPLQQANEMAARIAAGDLTAQGTVTRADEFGDLLRSLYAMCESLGRLVHQVRQSTDSIAIASAEIATGNQDLSSRTEQTSSNLQETAAAMEQFTSTIQQSASSAQQASSLANSATSVARKGGEVVTQVVSTMQDINQSSQKIADIISVIDGIAFQTNILALNAAVEAARAGEQGRGFAVVAGEVRTLAQRSAEAAKEIKSLIHASVEKVETGTRLVADAGTTMEDIVRSVQRVTDMIGEITAAASEQSAGVSQVNQAVGNLDQMTQQNAALVEESAAAAQSLREQADQLAQVVAVFRTAGGMSTAAPRAVAPRAAAAPAPLPAAPRPAAVPRAPAPARIASAPTAKPAPGKPAGKASESDGDWESF
ncbi:methyl-accepting chemotaxis protein [Acidovorax lacteus]|uniref:Methyl-accepting chemotaxis protein n=1 Tax=Acidovorax lacteus TaxID=1924988 RepID=A0ABP8LGI0_9BURK